MKLAYAVDAIADLVRLRAFIAEKNPSAAARIAALLIERIEHIRRFPELGRPVALAPQPRLVRDAVFGSYIVRYSVHAKTVVVLRIWHHYEERQPQM